MASKSSDELNEHAKAMHIAKQEGMVEKVDHDNHVVLPDPPSFGDYLREKMYPNGVPNQSVNNMLEVIDQWHVQYHNGWDD